MKILLLYIKGIAMGAADVVPGVSGGTVAFITGIYDRLLSSIANVNMEFLRLLLRKKFISAWKHIDATFLIVLFAGIVTSLLGLSKLVLFALETYPIPVWSFFGGLIIASTILILRHIGKLSLGIVLSCLLGLVIAYLVTSIVPINMPHDPISIFFSGAIAICAMILPGISGSFILLILGQYQYILEALHEVRILDILVFVGGCLFGLLSFSKALKYLLSKYHALTIALLAGFMLGSLNKIWPWKEVLQTYTNSEGALIPLVEKNITPAAFTTLTGSDSQVVAAAVLCVAGIVLVCAIDWIAQKNKTPITVIRA